jgi:hypothetical protein
MEILSIISDTRIETANVLIDLSYTDYLKVAEKILENNEFQRKQVIKGVVKNMLKEDLIIGCTFPPIVLAVSTKLISKNFDYLSFDDKEFIKNAFSTSKLILLDGLQRTHVLLEINSELKDEELKDFLSRKMRVEVLVGLNRTNLLYRMLTLNTGQTTMSTRHLMEIMYTDYANEPIEGVELVTDKQDLRVSPENLEQYKLKDVLDGFNSYLEKKEVTIKRTEILDNINAIKNMKDMNKNKDVFISFFKSFHGFIHNVNSLSESLSISIEDFNTPELKINNTTFFGKTFILFFKKSQALSGFGAAIKTLETIRNITFEQIMEYNKELILDDPKGCILLMNKHFDYIKENSKKIGNDQRYYLLWFFRKLYDNESDSFKNIEETAVTAFRKTREEKYT